jgi:hypothetical protein
MASRPQQPLVCLANFLKGNPMISARGYAAHDPQSPLLAFAFEREEPRARRADSGAVLRRLLLRHLLATVQIRF